jgi:dihydroflavonol-4-reductase
MGERAVVTGGSGYVGVNLIPHLLARGDTVVVVDHALHPLLASTPVEFVRADVRDPRAMRAVLDGADVVYHLAALISVAGGLGGVVADVNVRGTATVAAAARAARVGRFVHCGSVHAFDTDTPGPLIESSPRSTRPSLPAYDRSKAAGEEALRREVALGLDAVLLNPTGVIGPRDPGPSRTGRMLRAMRAGTLPALVAGGFDWIDVRDVVGALTAARDHGRTGENYLLAGHRLSVRELADLVEEVTGVPATRFTVPLPFARVWAPAATQVARWWDNPLLYTADTLHALATFPRIDDSRSRQELAHDPRPIRQTLADLFAWFDSPEFGAGRMPGRAPADDRGSPCPGRGA